MAEPTTIYSRIIHLFGPLDDHKVLEIIDLNPNTADLQVVASYIAGMTDVMGEERQPLTAKCARIYDIVRQDELLVEEND
jgi:hypothetical protein